MTPLHVLSRSSRPSPILLPPCGHPAAVLPSCHHDHAGENIAARPSASSRLLWYCSTPMTAEVWLETNRLASITRGLFLHPVVVVALCPGPCLSSRLP